MVDNNRWHAVSLSFEKWDYRLNMFEIHILKSWKNHQTEVHLFIALKFYRTDISMLNKKKHTLSTLMFQAAY